MKRMLLLWMYVTVFSNELLASVDTNTVNNWNAQALDLAYSNPEKAMSYASKALETSRKLHFTRGEVRALIRKGIIYDVQSEFVLATESYKESLKLAIRSRDYKAWASNLNNLGLIYWKQNELSKARSYLNKACAMFSKLGDHYNFASAANNIGLILEEQQRYREALNWHFIALNFCKKAGEKSMQLDIYSNIGNSYEGLHKLDSSRYYSRKAIASYRKSGNKYGLGIALNNLALSLNRNNEQSQAIPLFQESMNIAEEIGNVNSFVSSGYNLARAYARMGELQQELKTLEAIYPLIEQTHSKELGFKICHELSIVYYRTNRPELGLRMQDAYEKYHNAYYKEMIDRNLSEAEKKFQLREERQLNRFKLSQIESKRTRDNFVWMSAVLLLLLIGMLTFFIIRKRNLQRKFDNQKAVFQATNEERRRISYDLHDHVGSQLSYVVNNLELVVHQQGSNERIQKAFAMSQAAMGSLRDTVWALHSEELTLQSLAGRMENAARKTLEQAESIQLEMRVNIAQDQAVPPDETMQIMRIYQEAVHNAVRHSGGTILTVTLSQIPDGLQFVVADNGSGMEHTNGKEFHYGLQSMRERAVKIGGQFHIHSTLGKGTEIQLIWKNNPNA